MVIGDDPVFFGCKDSKKFLFHPIFYHLISKSSMFILHSSLFIPHFSPFPSLSPPFPQLSLSLYELKAKKFEGMRDFLPQKRCAS